MFPDLRIIKKMREYYVYILASKRNGTLYVGMTENLGKRAIRHKEQWMRERTEDKWRSLN
ncbi:MAG: GIY-YIG nuclease family protein [Sedimentisphaerales bacterium]|nr:GIY-YIG nuclease family protein [Sedimentisphaerales bacterium]